MTTVIFIVIRVFLGLLFSFTGVLKFIDLMSFSEAIHKFQFVRESYIPILTVIIPSIELFCGISLILSIFKKGASYCLLFLMLLFTITLGVMLSNSTTFNCNCFGPLQKYLSPQITGWSVVLNMMLIGLLLLLIIKGNFKNSLLSDLKPICIGIVFFFATGSIHFNSTNFEVGLLEKNILKIDYITAAKIVKRDGAILIDARPKIAFDTRHYPNAISIPHDKFEENYIRLKGIDTTIPLIVYCDPGI